MTKRGHCLSELFESISEITKQTIVQLIISQIMFWIALEYSKTKTVIPMIILTILLVILGLFSYELVNEA